MSTERTLDRIDATLDDWDQWDGRSPDAARWAGGPDETEWDETAPPWHTPCGHSYHPAHNAAMAGDSHVIVRPGERRLWVSNADDPAAPTLPELESAVELTPYVVAIDHAATIMLRAAGLEPVEWQRFLLNAWFPQPPAPRRPKAAADRTCSPRRRAGSRRTKKHARRGARS